MNATLNGRARKTLAQQLDRMDTMLDGLAEGLNEAVATAATAGLKEVVGVAVHQAVRSTLTELLSHPEFRTVPTAESGAIGGFVARAKAVLSWLGGPARRLWGMSFAHTRPRLDTAREMTSQVLATAKVHAAAGCVRLVGAARHCWMLATALASLAKRYRVPVALAVAVGTVVGCIGWWAGREIAALGCGLSGFAGSLASVISKQPRQASSYLVKFPS